MALTNGDVLVIQIGGTQVGALLSNSFNAAADMLEGTSKDSGGAKEYASGEYGWGMSLEAFYDPAATEGFSEALGYLKAGTELDLYWGSSASGGTFYQGAGFISSVDLGGPKNEFSSYSAEVQGSGIIVEGTAT